MSVTNQDIIEHLNQFITEERQQLFNEVLKYRTRYITVVLEDIYQPFNASAVLRSCDCFGIQDLHVIENENKYQVNPYVSVGAAKWVDLIKYNQEQNNTIDAIQKLKKQGYRIVATSPHADDVTLNNFDINKGKFALMFGSEKPGLSEVAMEHADEYLRIPMFGFTESYNISVSAALCLQHLSHKLHESNIPFNLSKEEEEIVRIQWMKKSIRHGDKVIDNFINNISEG